MEIKVKAKRWGSSIGFILPKIIVEEKGIKDNDEIVIEVKDGLVAENFFGKFPRKLKKTGQEIKDELRKGWEGFSDKEKDRKWKKKKG